MKALRIWWMKRQARQAYMIYQRAVRGLPCGVSLAGEISGAALSGKIKFNEAMDKLAALDPKTPAARL